MTEIKDYIALFDLDGVILDSEGDYTKFWDEMGKKYLGVSDFGITIKGQTLVKILGDNYRREDHEEITTQLMDYESKMPFQYIPGARRFLDALSRSGVRMAVVTSSDKTKMSNVYRRHPEFHDIFDRILTSEDFAASKPSPDCYLKGMAALGADSAHTVVFEDSISGLISGRDSGATVVALSTTNPVDVVSRYADYVIPDFSDCSFQDFIGHKNEHA